MKNLPENHLSQLDNRPLRFLLSLALGISLSEIVAMSVVYFVQPPTFFHETLLDVIIMTSLILPILYFFSLRPLLIEIYERKRAEAALRKANVEQEEKVIERTADLAQSNQTLEEEISERKRAEAALRDALNEAHRRQLEIAGLLEGAQAVMHYQTFSEAAKAIFDIAKRVIGADAGYITLVRKEEIHAVFSDTGSLDNQIALNMPNRIRGLRRQAYESKQVLYENNFPSSPTAYILPAGHIHLGNVMLAPLILFNEPVGLMGFANKAGGFSEDDARMAKAFSGIAAIALQNSQNLDALQNAHDQLEQRVLARTQELQRAVSALQQENQGRRKVENLLRMQTLELEKLSKIEREQRNLAERLYQTSLLLTRSLELEKVIDALFDELAHHAPYDCATLVLYDGDYHPSIEGQRGFTDCSSLMGIMEYAFQPRQNPDIQKMIDSTQSVEVIVLSNYTWWQDFASATGIEAWLGLPLAVGGRLLGFVSLGKREPKGYPSQSMHIAQTVVGQAVVALQNAWLFNQVKSGQNRFRHYSHWLVQVEENMRRYIARELHDEAGQTLASLMMGLRVLEKETAHSTDLHSLVIGLKTIAGNVLENLHRLAKDLRPASLDHLGLVDALAQHIRTLESEDLEITFEAGDLAGCRLIPELETNLYRIVQEALSNVFHHAHAKHVHISSNFTENCLALTISDDGCGFDVHKVRSKDRLGLLGMQERIEIFEGSMRIDSSPGAGTTIFIEVPYDNTIVDCG